MAESTVALVKKAHQTLFTLHQFDVAEEFFSPQFIEHSPLVKQGLKGLKELIERRAGQFSYSLERAFSDGEYVVLHGLFEGLSEQPLVGFDLYRVVQGRIIEHWDMLVDQMPPNSSGHTQLDGVRHLNPEARRSESLERVLPFFQTVLIDQQYDKISLYTTGESFIQHSSDIGDGAAAMEAFLVQAKASGNALNYHHLHRVVASGDFVFTHSEGDIGGRRAAFGELWRVEAGGVAELWDAIMPVPLDEEALHPYGIF